MARTWCIHRAEVGKTGDPHDFRPPASRAARCDWYSASHDPDAPRKLGRWTDLNFDEAILAVRRHLGADFVTSNSVSFKSKPILAGG